MFYISVKSPEDPGFFICRQAWHSFCSLSAVNDALVQIDYANKYFRQIQFKF
jgi:hypothetical protein